MSTTETFDIGALRNPTATASDGDGFLKRIQNVTLPVTAREVIEKYDALIGERDRFTWKWIHSLFPSFELSSVDDALQTPVRTQKTLLTVFVTVIDDLAENHRDIATFEEARHIPFSPGRVDYDRDDADTEILRFLDDLWETLSAELSAAPRYEEFADIFEFDLRQTMNSIEYGYLVNENLALANMSGSESYTPHNMCMFSYGDIDLMHSPEFEQNDLGVLRETLWDVQRMARIGNDLTTWVRELGEGDYSAGIITYALQHSLVSHEELETVAEDDLIARIREHCVEERFLNDWWDRYEDIKERAPAADTLDLSALLDGMHTVMEYHLASQGYK